MEIVIPPLPELIGRIPKVRTLGMLLAGGLILWALSSPDAPSYVSVTRDQYKESLGKWQALGVREYQANVAKAGADSYCTRGCILHVRTDGHTAEIVGDVPRPGLAGMSKIVPHASLQGMTIEEMFAFLDSLLPDASGVSPFGSNRAVLGGMAYTVRFNPNEGYPESLEARLYNDRFNITRWADVNWAIQVRSVTLIAQERK
jgi:hypothetical protein